MRRTTSRLIVAALTLATPLVVNGCSAGAGPGGIASHEDTNCNPETDPNCDDPALATADQAPFKDTRDTLPSDYTGPQFHLSQNYPTQMPTHGQGPWGEIDPTTDPDAYMMAVRDYVYAGLGVKGADTVDFSAAEQNGWYGMPWMDAGANPREAIHGLTREIDGRSARLNHGGPDIHGQSWGVGFYNDLGGYALGKVWKNHTKPDTRKAVFPEGTVVVKTLFTGFTPDQVPAVDGAFAWDANINSAINSDSKAIQKVRLFQMDISVKDKRAGTSGWFFGTFVYDKTAPGDDGFAKMMPMGIAWGNELEHTVVAKHCPEFAKDLFGFEGRMNGPVDNAASACMSCHMTAEFHPTKRPSAMTPPVRGDKSRWFRTLPPTQAFDDGFASLDYSMQLTIALRNFKQERAGTVVVPTGVH